MRFTELRFSPCVIDCLIAHNFLIDSYCKLNKVPCFSVIFFEKFVREKKNYSWNESISIKQENCRYVPRNSLIGPNFTGGGA